MAKLSLKPLDGYRFEYHTTIKVRDINYGGHLGNDALVGLLQEARIALLRELGCGELDLGDGETGIIMNELVVSYRSEGRLHDEITVLSEITEVRAASFRISHRVARQNDTLALAEVGIVAYDYRNGRIATIPMGFARRIKGENVD